MPKNEVLYIPGLGGNKSLRIQQPYLRLLGAVKKRRYHFFDPRWEDAHATGGPESNEAKFKRLNDEFEAWGKPGIIYANSAGAALAARLAIERSNDIESCHLVCGKLLGAEKIQRGYRERAPALVDAVKESEKVISEADDDALQKIFCYVPRDREDDGVLEVIDMIFPGANVIEMPPLTHARAIIHAARNYLPGV